MNTDNNNFDKLYYLIISTIAIIITIIIIYLIFKEYNKKSKKTGKSKKQNTTQSGGAPMVIDSNLLIFVFIFVIFIIGIIVYLYVKTETDNKKLIKDRLKKLDGDLENIKNETSSNTTSKNVDIVANGMPVNQRTRGDLVEYDAIGYLYPEGLSDQLSSSDTKINTAAGMLPLYGRPIYRGSNMWNYYTSTDQYNTINVPLMINNKKSTDKYGVKEIYNGDKVKILGNNAIIYVVQLYERNDIRYIPYI